ncbi:AAA family ATPase [Streptomyces sp. F63]|uniref:ATP-binding protein n=1 Tax=Streptomyces sp. F63 TaxID=2824887 RepID=UPI001B37DA9A|nr:ATP-binding protein [Streptomyces sp. F63]MBQ0986196.1 AAA family ATPase [Streptomyces sp. F63]
MGRSDLLDRLHGTLRTHGRAVLTGAPGAGRSAVLDAVAATAESRGETVLRLVPGERDRSVPGAAATELLAAIPTAALAPLPGMSFRSLPGSLPTAGTGLRSGGGTRPGTAGAGFPRATVRGGGRSTGGARAAGGRRAAGASTGRARRGGPLGAAPAASVPALLRRLAGEWPVLLVIDDAQWLDEESVLLLRSVLHPGAGTVPAELRLLIAERIVPGEPREPVALALCGATPRDTITLPPLDTAATAELLARHGVPPRLRDAVHRASGGNPGRALSVARALAAVASPELAAG